MLKHLIDNGPNYTEKMKRDLKNIIDAGNSSEEILEAALTYFASIRFS